MARSTPNSGLVCGDVQGHFRVFFKTVTKINKQAGPFEAVYCVGNFFGESLAEWELVKSKSIKVPVPCYILGPCKPEHEKYFPDISGMELAPNVIYLGKKGILTTSSGLKVAYLSGSESRKESKHTFTAKDICDLQHNFQSGDLRGVDFLLTSQWPKDVTHGIPAPLPNCAERFVDICGMYASYAVRPAIVSPQKYASELVAVLAVTVKPCYHFAGLEGIYYQRHPYRNPKSFSDKFSHTTKFVGLGAVANNKGVKYFYGINHIPLHKITEEILKKEKQTEMSTECPYQVKSSDLIVPEIQTLSSSSQSDRVPERKVKRHSEKRSMLNCWFCLRLPIEKHLLVTVGEHKPAGASGEKDSMCTVLRRAPLPQAPQNCYVSFAKGWLTEDHLLIISNSHYSSTASLKEDILCEINYYKHILKEYFHSKDKHVVFYERNFKTPHLQIQVVPVPVKLGTKLEEAFVTSASSFNITLKEVPPYSVMKQIVGPRSFYFFLEIEYTNNQPKKFIHIIEEDFPLLFARHVLASEQVLNVTDRLIWKDCIMPFAEEKAVCDAFKKDFLKFQLNA